MAAPKVSKNNPDARKTSPGKMVASSDCEVCKEQCQRGTDYLARFKSKGQGHGVFCKKAK